ASAASAASAQPIMTTPPTAPNTIVAWLHSGSGSSNATGCTSAMPTKA
ncbi:MAG: hypothetical protein H6R06_4187, partial [Proteobacteria bacterium]|nr:hypothetical protein [Pseudomonadota bacterium]